MKQFGWQVVLAIALAGGLVQAQDAIKPSDTVRYATFPGVAANLNSLDVYTTPELKNAPVMIYVHGGGWAEGDKGNVSSKPGFFLQNNVVFVSVNYRLSPRAFWPSHIEDVAQAIAWVKNNIARYGGNPARLYLMGHSAGAHLVALVATDGSYLGRHRVELSNLKAIVLLDSAAYDIPAIAASNGGRLGEAYRDVFGMDPAVWRQASPIYYVAPNKGIPPMAVAYTTGVRRDAPQSGLSRGDATEGFVRRLGEAGIAFQVIPTDQTHGEINSEFGSRGDEVTRKTMEFLARFQ
jgi:arylformamidase